MGLSEEDVEAYITVCNGLPNLQLLQSTQNIQKSDKSLVDWLSLTYTSLSDKESFLRQNYIGTSDSLSFDDFLDFIVARRTALKNQFMNMLNVSSV